MFISAIDVSLELLITPNITVYTKHINMTDIEVNINAKYSIQNICDN